MTAETKGFPPLGSLVRPDTPQILKKKSLFKEELAYGNFLAAIEYAIAQHFLRGRKLKDKDAIKAIKNIKKNYAEPLVSFGTALEQDIVQGLSQALQREPITHHELKLVLDYMLWAIDNRSWIPDKQAYVKWVPHACGLYDAREARQYEDDLEKVMKRMGVPQNRIDAMLERGEDPCLNESERVASRVESEFFASNDERKFDFVFEHVEEHPFLIGIYLAELEECGNCVTIERFCKKILEIMPACAPIKLHLAVLYKKQGNLQLAGQHLKSALCDMEALPDDIISDKERLSIIEEIRHDLKELAD